MASSKMKNKASVSKNISAKNYFILFLIVFGTGFLVWYICRWYQVYDNYEMQVPIIRDTLSYEITPLDFDHYIMENPTSVIYMCTASDIKCRNFERDFKKYITKNELQNDILYLNLSDLDINAFVKNFNNNYKYKVKLTTNYPAIVEFTDGKITGLVQGDKNSELTISKVSSFIDLHHIGESYE